MLEPTTAAPAIRMVGVGFTRDSRPILDRIDWLVEPGQRWVVLGANGSGKTTLIRLAALYDHPSAGRLAILGSELGRCDVRALRRRIGFVSAGFADLIRPDLRAVDIVMCALHAALEPWWHHYTEDDRDNALAVLSGLGLGALSERRFGTLSSGERQRVQLARTLMTRPELLLFDEPAAGLDLLGRETLVDDLDAIDLRGADTDDRNSGGLPARAMVLATHHVEEIPASFTHALLLGRGRVIAQGPIDPTLTSEAFSESAGVNVRVNRSRGRWSASRAEGVRGERRATRGAGPFRDPD